MKPYVLALFLTFSHGALAINDHADLKGDPLSWQALEFATLFLDHRDEVAVLYQDVNGVELKFLSGTVKTAIQNSAMTVTYVLETQRCDGLGNCTALDALVIEKSITSGPEGLQTVFKPFERRPHVATTTGVEILDADLEFASIFLTQRSEIFAHYSDRDALGDARLAVTRGVFNIQWAAPELTTTFDLEIGMCADASRPDSCFWLSTLKIEEKANHGPNGTAKKYKISARGSGLG